MKLGAKTVWVPLQPIVPGHEDVGICSLPS
jgi:hypothetical protein